MSTHRELAIELMSRFAERTGLTAPGGETRRYLWTDAFAVCNLLGLARSTGDARWQELALRLVDRVHHVLGRRRPDDTRTGWISGLPDVEGETHPTLGGLRIGKPLPERRLDEPEDERLEWDRDGQYFHYLTKWMHALHAVGRATGQAIFDDWARELARTAHRAFTWRPHPGAAPRMHWKRSVDLSRPLVASMGQHDPLDGFVTYTEIAGAGVELRDAVADFAAMLDPRALATADPLGLGGLLVDASRLVQPVHQGAHDALAEAVLAAAVSGLRHYLARPDLRAPAEHRLAFREIGLSIGLAAVERADRRGAGPRARELLAHLTRYLPLRTGIDGFWLQPAHRRVASWLGHADINDVMLATSLAPDGFLS